MSGHPTSGLVYLNNAATSYPKPAAVIEAVHSSLLAPPVEPGRTSGSGDPLIRCRASLARLLGVERAEQIVLTQSATWALNVAILGLARAVGSGRLLTSALEHNSVLRPLEHLRRTGDFEVHHVEADGEGRITPEALEEALEGGAAFIVLTCASNVSGAIQPVEALAEVAARASVPIIFDAAQSAGCIPIEHRALAGRVILVFAGHKGLCGPAGTGGMIVPDDELPQIIVGGTGIRSERLLHPEELPLRHEAGTANLPGVAGLDAGVREVLARGVEELGAHRAHLVARAREGLAAIESVGLLPLPDDDGRAGIVAFTCGGQKSGEVGFTLREAFGIEVRTGLHCAPLAQQSLSASSTSDGCVRASVGPSNTEAEVEQFLTAIGAICQR